MHSHCYSSCRPVRLSELSISGRRAQWLRWPRRAELARPRWRLGDSGAARSIFLGLLLLLAAGPSWSSGSTHPTGAWIEVLDAKGRPAEDLSASDLTIHEPGGAARISGVGRPLAVSGAKGQVVLYFDQALAGRGALRRAADALSDTTTALASMGEIEVVSASVDDGPQVQIRSADPFVLSERLGRMALTERSERLLYSIRERALLEWREGATADPPMTLDERVASLSGSVAEERELVQNRIRRLVTWVTREGVGRSAGPKVLMVVMEGFDLDPLAFYLERLDETTAEALRSAVGGGSLESEVRSLARTLAASGWVVFPVSMPITNIEQKAAEYTNIQAGDDDQQTVVPGITLRPGRLFGRQDDEELDEQAEAGEVRLMDPQEPLFLLATGSGGELLTTDSALRDTVQRLGQRRWVTWDSAVTYEQELAAIEVKVNRPEWIVRAPRWRSLGTPVGLADLRLDRVLSAGMEGDLTLAAVLEVPADPEADGGALATLDIRLDLHDLEGDELRADGTRADLRVSVQALGLSDEEPLILREVLPNQDLSSGLEWRFQRRIDLPADATAVAVLVEDLAGGAWGGRRATVVRAAG